MQIGSKHSAETIQKRQETWVANGNMSRGQRKLYEVLLSVGFPFVPECYFDLGNRKAFVDAFIPFCQLVIEYDGYRGHCTIEGQEEDRMRDAKLNNLHGVKVIRIDQKSIFTDVGLNQIGEALRTMP